MGALAFLWDGWHLRQEIGEGGDWLFIVSAVLFLFTAAVGRYVVRQLRTGCAFAEIIEVDDDAVLYRFLSAGSETRWSEPLENYEGIRIHGRRLRDRTGGVSDYFVRALPRSVKFGVRLSPLPIYGWEVLLVHPGSGKSVRLFQQQANEKEMPPMIREKAEDFARRLRLALLPTRHP